MISDGALVLRGNQLPTPLDAMRWPSPRVMLYFLGFFVKLLYHPPGAFAAANALQFSAFSILDCVLGTVEPPPYKNTYHG